MVVGLKQVTGAGTLTALTFVLTFGDVTRFERSGRQYHDIPVHRRAAAIVERGAGELDFEQRREFSFENVVAQSTADADRVYRSEPGESVYLCGDEDGGGIDGRGDTHDSGGLQRQSADADGQRLGKRNDSANSRDGVCDTDAAGDIAAGAGQLLRLLESIFAAAALAGGLQNDYGAGRIGSGGSDAV